MGKVLIVEDESDLVWLIRFNLEREGYQTYVAPNGRHALDLLERHRPGLMLLDLMMPVMDGWSVLEELRRRGGDRPSIIVVSARAGAADKARSVELGADAFVSKPFDLDELISLIKQLMPVEGDPS